MGEMTRTGENRTEGQLAKNAEDRIRPVQSWLREVIQVGRPWVVPHPRAALCHTVKSAAANRAQSSTMNHHTVQVCRCAMDESETLCAAVATS